MKLMTDKEIFAAIASKEGWTEREQPMKNMITLLGNPQKRTFNVPNEFLEMLQQKADSRNVKVPVIFNELIQEILEKETDMIEPVFSYTDLKDHLEYFACFIEDGLGTVEEIVENFMDQFKEEVQDYVKNIGWELLENGKSFKKS